MLTLILKGTNGCNLNCAYCSLGEKVKHDVVSPFMLKHILEYACRLCQQRNDPQLQIILHGGEPTLVPVNTYDAAITQLKQQFPNIKVSISMQTNAFYISDEYLAFMQRHHVNVGVSIDGSAQIHDRERRSRNDLETYHVVSENMERMQSAGLNVSALMVLTSIGMAESLEYLYDFAARHIYLKINPLLNYGEVYKNPELSLKSGDYANYLIRIYEYIIFNDIDILVSPIDKILHAILNQNGIRECTFQAGCNKGFLCVDHAGDIYPCGKFSDIQKFKWGNVLTQTTDPMELSQSKLLVRRRSCQLPVQCRTCQYFDLCHAGCSAEAIIEGDLNKPPVLCRDYQMLFDYFSNKGLRLLKEQLVKSRQCLMEELNGV